MKITTETATSELKTEAEGTPTNAAFDETQMPGLAYQHAFDWLAVRLHSAGGAADQNSVACATPHAWLAMELLRRLPRVHMLPPRQENASTPPFAPLADERAAAVAWLEPWRSQDSEFGQIARTVQIGGHLHLLLGGSLARFLVEYRTAHDRQPRLGERRARHILQQHGFIITERIGLHGWRAIAWHGLSQLAARAGQPAWQDRCHYAMRRAFAQNLTGPRGARQPQAAGGHFALICITAERAQ